MEASDIIESGQMKGKTLMQAIIEVLDGTDEDYFPHANDIIFDHLILFSDAKEVPNFVGNRKYIYGLIDAAIEMRK